MTSILEITVTCLEMKHPPPSAGVQPPKGLNLEIHRLVRPQTSHYRRLYEQVGETWLWWERREMTDGELADVLSENERRVFVLQVDGEEAGFAEILVQNSGRKVQVVYFGLLPAFIGRGIGTWFLMRTVGLCWELGPDLVWLHTCTLDHPAALPLYRKAGFVPFKTRTESIPDPRKKGLFQPAKG